MIKVRRTGSLDQAQRADERLGATGQAKPSHSPRSQPGRAGPQAASAEAPPDKGEVEVMAALKQPLHQRARAAVDAVPSVEQRSHVNGDPSGHIGYPWAG
jgi:hypothetical protein